MKNKVLIVSISSLNEKVGSNTWKELLSFLEPTNIACISLRPGRPEKRFQSNYLIYDEKRIIKSVFNKKLIPCEIYKEDNYIEKNNNIYKNKEKFKFLKRIIREIVWKLSNWKNPVLKKFIVDFNPTHIVYFMDGYIHANRICKYAKTLTNSKTIGYFVDDTFSYKQSNNLLFLILRFFQRKSLKDLSKYTNCFWSINTKIRDEAEKIFNVKSLVVTKPIRDLVVKQYVKPDLPLTIFYGGHLGIGRDKTLIQLIDCLKLVNSNSVLFKLKVYSSTKLKIKKIPEFVNIYGAVNQKLVFEEQEKADILLFLESIKRKNANIARLSFSTKITDYLSLQKPILAIGTKNIFPMQYLKENCAAICCSSKEDIMNALISIANSPDILCDFANNSYNLGKTNHDRNTILRIVKECFDL